MVSHLAGNRPVEGPRPWFGGPNRIVFVGDSITTDGTVNSQTPGAGQLIGESWAALASYASQGRVQFAGMAAESGWTIAQVKTLIPNALAVRPRFVNVLVGINDCAGGTWNDATWTQKRTDYSAMTAAILAAGAIPVLCTLLPGNGSTNMSNLARLNAFIRSLAVRHGVPCVDFHRRLVDPADGTWLGTTNSSDEIHPSPAGKWVMATAWNEDFAAKLPLPIDPLARTVGKSASVGDPQNYNLLSGVFSTGSGTPVVPTGWSASAGGGSYTASLTGPDAYANGKWLRAGVMTGTSEITPILDGSHAGSVSAGDRIFFGCRLRTPVATSDLRYSLRLTVRNSSFAGLRDFHPLESWRLDLGSTTGILVSFEDEMPAGADNIAFSLTVLDADGSGSTGEVEISQVTLMNLTRMGVDPRAL